MTILLSDARVHAVRVLECGEPLEVLAMAPHTRVRSGLARRLEHAQSSLPEGLFLGVAEGHRRASAQQAIIDDYTANLRARHPRLPSGEIGRLSSRFVSPLAVAPHVAGAAVDLTLVDAAGRALDLGTPIDATPEQSHGSCFFAAPGISAEAAANRALLADVLGSAGLVNYPTEWWHWSFGDRYWALMTGAAHAPYGPVLDEVAA